MDNAQFYEHHWDTASFDSKVEQFEVIKDLIPKSVKSILDVGCGNGFLTNSFIGGQRLIVGVDRSVVGLAEVKTAKVAGSAELLPFPSECFDLVMSIELLEHLPENLFDKALQEMQRVRRHFILISVPLSGIFGKTYDEVQKVRCSVSCVSASTSA